VPAAEDEHINAAYGPFGDQQQPLLQSSLGSFIETILLAICIVIMIVAVFEVITLAINFSDIFSFLSTVSVSFIVIVPFPHTLFYVGGAALQAYWVIVSAIIVACVLYMVLEFVNAAGSHGGITQSGNAEKTAAFWICISLSVMFLFNFIVILLTSAAGSDIEVPDMGSTIQQMFLVGEAAVWEEIITRMLYIGVPLAVISLIVTRKKESLKCLLGGFGMSRASIAFIIISGVIFGLAHYPGWEQQAWKVVTAGAMGMFLGYMFVRFGLYASILLHFVNNYLSSFNWMGVGGLTMTISFVLLGTGFVALIYIIIRILDSKKTITSLPWFHNKYIKSE